MELEAHPAAAAPVTSWPGTKRRNAAHDIAQANDLDNISLVDEPEATRPRRSAALLRPIMLSLTALGTAIHRKHTDYSYDIPPAGSDFQA